MSNDRFDLWAARAALVMSVTGPPADVADRLGMAIGPLYLVALYLTACAVLLAAMVLLRRTGESSELNRHAKRVAACAAFVGVVMLASMLVDLWLFEHRLIGVSYSHGK